ncbi:organomercurial lyase [Paraburkholderia fungorum]|uniref:organomercurial lyase n=1 Tax=Paraburkholderia fungorum TaxID=134537 RepID=UPI0017B42985|nr:organomercurial lyase [Paraburkholderia fungorum]MBB4517492.1 hypothetical protein [Paraburkholderia fungorum]
MVLDALQRLRNAFPLQARIERAEPAVQAVYRRVLAHWVQEGSSDAVLDVAPTLLRALIDIDAVVIDAHGIGCYPFSDRKTDIRVQFADGSVHAMCAIAALAIPRLMHRTSYIAARCALCRCHLACEIAANGHVDGGNPQGIRVIWRPHAVTRPCGYSLCTGIVFVCRHCTVPPDVAQFSLPEAAAIGNATFSFQRRLLGHTLSQPA